MWSLMKEKNIEEMKKWEEIRFAAVGRVDEWEIGKLAADDVERIHVKNIHRLYATNIHFI